MHERPYSRPGDLRSLQRLAQEVWRIDPRVLDSDTTVGELAWSMGAGPLDPAMWDRRLWVSGEDVLGWGWLFQPAYLAWQVHPSRAGLLERVLDWFESHARQRPLRTSVRPDNEVCAAILADCGYVEEQDQPFAVLLERELATVDAPEVPSGFRLRTMDDVGDHERRLEVHRAAWEPSSLTAERWAAVRGTWPYREDLDCVAEAPDGTLAASVLAWLDADNALGELEPVGTHPAFRRKGIGRALSLFALRRLRAAGATRAIVGCRGDDAYPVPLRLYTSVGFRGLSRQRTLLKP